MSLEDLFDEEPTGPTPLDSAAWADSEAVITQDELEDRGAKRASEAPVLTAFSLGHTVAMDESGVKPLLVLGLELIDPHLGTESHETVLMPPHAAKLMMAALGDLLSAMGEPTVRDLKRVDL